MLSANSVLPTAHVLFEVATQAGNSAPHRGVHSQAQPDLSPPFSPQQIRQAYGINQISFGGVTGDGTGQTIAIIDWDNDPTITSDLQAFDAMFNLPAPPSFQILNENGGTNLSGIPNPSGTDYTETALDVEWSHAIAPGANIILVEPNSANFSDIFTAVNSIKTMTNATVVSMSFGTTGDMSGETSDDADFTSPTNAQGVITRGITFVASAGDTGVPSGYPAFSPNVLSVGGTSLFINADGSYGSETTWSGFDSSGGVQDGRAIATGGGTSTLESEPSYQLANVSNVSLGGKRGVPDVAFDADPDTGVTVVNAGSAEQIGGTSLSAPAWAGLIAIADQGRALAGLGSLDGATQTLPDLYAMYANGTNPEYSQDFHDITTGNNKVSNSRRSKFFSAGTGYDLVTGLGTPIANNLVPALVQAPTPTVMSVNETDGSASDIANYPNQRSMVTQVKVSFNTPVDLAPGAISVLNQTTGNDESLVVTPVNPTGTLATSYMVTFNGSDIIGGSLPDGNYSLTVQAGSVLNAGNQTMTANFQTFFYRLFGDINGDRFANSTDNSYFQLAFGSNDGVNGNPPKPNFIAAFDYNNDGFVNSTDTTAFEARFGHFLAPPAGAPAIPSALTATPGTAQIALNWTGSSGATSYNIYRSLTPGGEGLTPYQLGLIGTTFTNTGLTSGTTYYYTVTAVNASGESLHSSEASAKAQ